MFCIGNQDQEYSCRILLLDDTALTIEVKGPSTKGQVLLDKVIDHLNLSEKDYFGLRYVDEANQTHWLDASKPLKSQVKGPPPFVVYFGVKFYAADPCKLREEITRYQFFLQVKKDIHQGRIPVTFDQAAELSALAIQSDLGDYDVRRHSYGYVSEFRFVPNQTEELEERIAKLHRQIVGLVPSVAEYNYLDRVKWIDMYGVDLHPVTGDGNVEYYLGLTPTGVVIYKNKSKIGNYFWPRIVRIMFKGKQFMIRVRDKNNDENTHTFNLPNKQGCKHLWKCCVEHHAFFRLSHVTDGAGGKLFNLGSKYRYSGRTEKQTIRDKDKRSEPQVIRTPSKRQQRRSGDSLPDGNTSQVTCTYSCNSESAPALKVVTPAQTSSKSPYHDQSPRSTRSAPWEMNEEASGGLYTTKGTSPLSFRSDKIKFPAPRRIPSSGSESDVRRRQHRSRKGSGDSDTMEQGRRRRTRSRGENGDSHSSRHRSRHHRSQEMVSSEAQWHEVQKRQKENGTTGSMRSLHSNHSEASQHKRKQRRRSRSPRVKPPEELRQHFQYGLVDPTVLTEDQRRDIPYMEIETKAEPHKGRQSPHARYRRRSPYRKSQGEEMEKGLKVSGTQDENRPPTPDQPSRNVTQQKDNRSSRPTSQYSDSNYHQTDRPELNVRPAASVYKQEFHSAPIVKTKPVAVFMVLAPETLPGLTMSDNLLDPKWLCMPTEDQGPVKNGVHLREDSGICNDQDSYSGSVRSDNNKPLPLHVPVPVRKTLDSRPLYYQGMQPDRYLANKSNTFYEGPRPPPPPNRPGTRESSPAYSTKPLNQVTNNQRPLGAEERRKSPHGPGNANRTSHSRSASPPSDVSRSFQLPVSTEL
ncbi:band 4.1-like protein 4 isoform X2 [Lineus longissimus]|uniref:band 4.1-like protein 4 isoform X2 n=1 Tax=Lineus longissimus TaxID=88925 RepID=UPI00315CB9B7